MPCDRRLPERRGIELGVLLMQGRDHLEVADQGAQLRGRAQVELYPFVDIERLVEVVGLHAHPVAAGRALEQRNAVGHAAWIAMLQEVIADQPGGLGVGGVTQLLQLCRHFLLELRIQRTVDGQIEAVQIIPAGHAERTG